MEYLYNLKHVQKEEHLGSVVIKSLKEVNLDIEKGSFNTICGPEGSGKSRLISLLNLMEMPSSGEFFFKESKISQLTEREINATRANHISYIPQCLCLNLTSSVLENVWMMAKIMGHDNKDSKEKALYWLQTVGLYKKALCIPLELDLLDIKKICIAKCMVKNPEVLLLDDIYHKLTAAASEELQNLLVQLSLNHRVTTVQTTRNENLAKAGSSIYDINNGVTNKRCLASSAA
jgi:putative ABC transport system ATP-binding protein